jgi:hypothetical protein
MQLDREILQLVAVLLLTGCGVSRAYVDDAGDYHAPDGAVVFTPGSACVGWDASHLDDPAPLCDDAGACEAYIANRSPPGSPVIDKSCESTNGYPPYQCAVNWDFGNSNSEIPSCSGLTKDADDYCAAWLSQFFVHGERPQVQCAGDDVGNGPYSCFPGARGGVPWNVPCGIGISLQVEFIDGGVGCEAPCTP